MAVYGGLDYLGRANMKKLPRAGAADIRHANRQRKPEPTASWWLLGFVLMSLTASSRAEIRLNEFVASNETGLRTAAGVAADWIELYNAGTNAVDLSGWYLTDRAQSPTKWSFPEGVILPAGEYLVIFADSSPVAFTNNELHANFSLSKDGEYLGLIQPDGVTVEDEYAPAFPPQYQDISYGRAAREYERVGATTPVRYRVPNATGNAPWKSGRGGLGFTGTNATFTVRYYEMTSSMTDVDVAERRIGNSRYWKTDRPYPLIESHATINFHANGSAGYFGDDKPFPGHAYIGEDRDNFVVAADGVIHIPEAGAWTFAVGSDDGFRLRLTGHGVNFVGEFPNPRGFGTTFSTFNFPVAGDYALSLVFYENGGSASLELSAAPGTHTEFSSAAFRLVGDVDGGLRHAGAIGAYVTTDVGDDMRGFNARLDAEWIFSLNAPWPEDHTALLLVRCADGFSASLNGTPLAELNLPPTLRWNSAATATRTTEEALQPLVFAVPPSAFVIGTNILAIVALNNTWLDPEFLIQPRLIEFTSPNEPGFFATPTPRSANQTPLNAPTPIVAASEPRGFKTAPFSVTLTSAVPNVEIRYTLDGRVPQADSPLYTGPLPINTTTTLRAAVVDPESVQQNVTTVTWLFLEDVLRQGDSPPPGWPGNRAVNNHAMEYGMRQAIVNSDGARLRQGMTNRIPSLSIVTDLAHLFNAQTGIYVNPGNDGRAWERPVSVELIDPVHGSTNEFQINAGLRIRGAYSRSSNNPKHSFRLFFRSDYGSGRLRFPLFGEEGADSFDKVDLRCSQNFSWAFENSDRETFVRETFSRDVQRDMGMPYTRSRYYHLYLNGQYWGLYQTQERGDADFAKTYLGGSAEYWDCIKTSHPGYVTTASDGNFDAFYAFHQLAVSQGFTGPYTANYPRVKGLNPDGTPNPAYPMYLDEDNLIVCMLSAYYSGDPDSPVSIWGGFPNNMYALFNRVTPSGFKWLRHDAEHSLGANTGFGVTADTTTAGANFNERNKFNPATLHLRLSQHPDYRRRFADLVQKHLFGDGPLTPQNAQNRFRSRMNEIDLAIIGESARWGRGKTRDGTWLPACNEVLNNYLNQRRDIVVSQFRARGWFPTVVAPDYSFMNQMVPVGQSLRISAPTTFYFTTNGADPRLPSGGIHPAAIAVVATNPFVGPRTLIPRGATWRYYDLGVEPPTLNGQTWRAPGYPAGTWPQGPAILGFAGTGTVNPVATTTRRYVSGSSGPQVTTTYLRTTFTLDTTNNNPQLLMEILRDDGAVVYLNGTEILRENMPAGAITYATYSSSIVGPPAQNTYYSRTAAVAHLLRPGTNTVAVSLHQCNAGSTDLYFDFALVQPGEAAWIGTNLAISNNLIIKARALHNGEWSALSENTLTVERPPDYYAPLRVTELMYAPPAPPPDSPYESNDFAWIELRNTGATALDLEGVRFADGIKHTFAPLSLAPGARLVLAKNPEAFAIYYPTQNLHLVAWDGGNLARGGELLTLETPVGSNILSFTYSRLWYPETFNTGHTLVVVDPAAEEPAWSTAENWRPSNLEGGTPGHPEVPRFTAAQLTPDGQLALEIGAVEDPIELWHSMDLENWMPCASDAWSRSADTIIVNLQHPSFAGTDRRFLQIRIPD